MTTNPLKPYTLKCIYKDSKRPITGPRSQLKDLLDQLNKTSDLMKLPITFTLEEIKE